MEQIVVKPEERITLQKFITDRMPEIDHCYHAEYGEAPKNNTDREHFINTNPGARLWALAVGVDLGN